MAALISKPGISRLAGGNAVPKEWSQSWFRDFISDYLKGADVRNAVGANGLKVSGNISTPFATIGFAAPITLPGPVTITAPTGTGPTLLVNQAASQDGLEVLYGGPPGFTSVRIQGDGATLGFFNTAVTNVMRQGSDKAITNSADTTSGAILVQTKLNFYVGDVISGPAVTFGSAGNVIIQTPPSAGTLPLLVNMNGASAGNCQEWTDGINIVTLGLAAAALWQFGTNTNTALQIFTKNSTRISIAAAGNTVINAADSGNTLVVNGFAGSGNYAAIFQGGNVAGARGVYLSGGSALSSDIALFVQDAPQTHTLFLVQCGATNAGISGYGPTAATLVDMTPDKSSWTTTLSGPWVAGNNPTGTLKWEKNGLQVTIWCDTTIDQVATIAATIAASGLPAEITPSTSREVPCFPLENNSGGVLGYAFVNSAGTINFSIANVAGATVASGNFTGAGRAGILANCSFTYSL